MVELLSAMGIKVELAHDNVDVLGKQRLGVSNDLILFDMFLPEMNVYDILSNLHHPRPLCIYQPQHDHPPNRDKFLIIAAKHQGSNGE